MTLPSRLINIRLSVDFVQASQKSCFLEAEESRAIIHRLSHNDVVKKLDLENACTECDLLGEPQIRVRGAHTARGVVVYQRKTE